MPCITYEARALRDNHSASVPLDDRKGVRGVGKSHEIVWRLGNGYCGYAMVECITTWASSASDVGWHKGQQTLVACQRHCVGGGKKCVMLGGLFALARSAFHSTHLEIQNE